MIDEEREAKMGVGFVGESWSYVALILYIEEGV
jgi:hypothetical protein